MEYPVSALVGGGFAGLTGIKMVLAGRSGNKFSGLGLLDSLGCSLVGFYFRHVSKPLTFDL